MADPISAAGTFILQLLKEIQNTGNNWYLASQEWQEFPRQVQQLQRKLGFWETGCANRGLSQNAVLNESLQDVKSQLEEEVKNLNKRAGSCWAGCWPRLHMTVFPARLGMSIEGAITAFNNIPEILRLSEEAEVTLDRLVQRQPFSDPINPDSRYVILQDSEKQVCEAVENPDGPAVILLHGGPGKGKTTLARNVAVHYDKSNQPVFNHVFFLVCGPQAKAEDTQFELIQRLGFEPSASLQDDEKIRSIRIRKQIKALLSAKKVLIILDDVSDGEFLECIVELCGEKVKFLVTSQESTLCRALDRSKVHKIQIQDLDMEGAKEILASHVGLPGRRIPVHVQEVAEAMIHKTDLNPLALASLANGIGHDRSNELVEWEEASSNLLKVLDSEVPAVFHGMYPRSFWSTTKLSMQRLAEDSRRLLLLIHACEGPLIPEEVVKVLYKGLASPGDPGTFSSIARDELVNRQLVKITTVEAGVSSSKVSLNTQRDWSVHSLHRLYIEKEMAQERDSIITSLIDGDRSKEGDQMDSECEIVNESKEIQDDTILTTLCALYLDNPLASVAQKKLCIPPKSFSNMRRNAIEPITRLLGQPLSPRWTEMHRRCVAKVFMSYICNGTLDDSSISHLLGVDIAAPAMCGVLKDIAIIEETCLLNENTRGLMEVLVTWLTKGPETNKQAALSVLFALAYNTSHSLFMISFPGVLEGILQSLINMSDLEVPNYGSNMRPSEDALMEALHSEELAGMALANLACGGTETKYKIVNHAGVLSKLVNSLCRDDNPRLQEEAARALATLAYEGATPEIKEKIANHPGVLFALANSLSKDINPSLQVMAMKAFISLTYEGTLEIIEKIVNHEEVLSKLVKSLSEDVNPRLQEDGARALANLSCYEGLEIRDKMVNHLGLLSELVKSLSKDINPKLQEEVAGTLTNLALEGTLEMKDKIVSHPGVISELAKSLSKDANPKLQEEVVRALTNLAHEGTPKIKDKIVSHLGVLSELAKLLSKDTNPKLQEEVAGALNNLAYKGTIEMKDKIVNHPGILSELAKSLSKDANSTLQEVAVRTLTNLAYEGTPKMKDKIVSHLGVLSELAKLLSKDTNPKLQEDVARALNNLAHEGTLEIKDKIVNHPGILSELAKSLSKDVNPRFQEQVVTTLINLSYEGEFERNDKIVNHSQVLSELVNSLSKDINPNFQALVVKALGNLACGGPKTNGKIVNHPGLLLELVNLLSNDNNPSLQAELAHTFVNFAGSTSMDETIVQIGNHPGVISELVKSLSKESSYPTLQDNAAWALCNLASIEGNIMMMKATEGIIEGLAGLLSQTTKWHAAFVLTLVDPKYANEEHLQSASYLEGRTRANYWLGLFKEALVDYNEGRELGLDGDLWDDLRGFSTVLKAKVGDYQGAMMDTNKALNTYKEEDNKDGQCFHLQERGMLKMMMGDLHGALADFNEGLAIHADDYEILKQRGYLKFRLGDEEGARADAELALRAKLSRIDVDYAHYARELNGLGTSSVEYLGYRLR